MSSRLVCTIITKPYWAHARVLAESLREHNPQLPPLLVLLADRLDGYFDPTHEPFQLVRLEELPDQEQVAAMSFYYTPFEFCNALRPVFHDYILNCTEAESWIYLDSDILILHSLDDIFNQIENHSIVLSPHLTAPTDPCDVETEEFPILHGGIYNSGCLGLHRTAETRAFVAWFKDRLRWFCFQDHKNGFVDQGWLNYVPLFFGDVSFLVTQGANLGHWRLRGHRISKKKERFHVDSNPLIFMHFSGWSPDVSELVSVYNSSLSPEECVGWKEIAALYESLLRDCGWETVRKLPCAFSTFSDGAVIKLHHRRYYYSFLRAGNLMEESPFRSLRSFLACIKPVGSFWKAITFSVLELILAFAPSMPLWEEKIVGRIIVEYILALRIDAWAKY